MNTDYKGSVGVQTPRRSPAGRKDAMYTRERKGFSLKERMKHSAVSRPAQEPCQRRTIFLAMAADSKSPMLQPQIPPIFQTGAVASSFPVHSPQAQSPVW